MWVLIAWLKIFWRLLIIDIKILPGNLKMRCCNWQLRRIERIRVRKGLHFIKSPEIQALEKEAMGKFVEIFPGITVRDYDRFVESPPLFSLRFLRKSFVDLLFKY